MRESDFQNQKFEKNGNSVEIFGKVNKVDPTILYADWTKIFPFSVSPLFFNPVPLPA